MLALDAATAVAVPNLIKYLTDFLDSKQQLPTVLGFTPSVQATVPVIAAAIVVATALNSSSESLADISLATAARTLGFRLRGALFAHLQRLPLAFHLRRGTGDVLTRITGDVRAMEDFIEDSVSDLVGSGLILVATMAYLVAQSWQIALLALVIVPLLTVISNLFARRIKSASKQQRASEGDLASTAQEMLSTISLVQVYGRGEVEERKFEQQSRSARDAFVRTARLDAFFGFSVAVVQSLGIAVVILLGARLVTGGSLSAGQLIAFILLIENMFKPVRRIIKQWNRVAGVYASVERVGDLLDLRATVVDAPDARPAPPLRGEIEFRDVSFAYEPQGEGPDRAAGRLALDGLSFRSPPGSPWRSSGAAVRARAPSPSCCRGCTTRTRAPSSSTATTSGSSPSTRCGRRSAWCCRRRCCCAAPSPRTSATAGRGPPRDDIVTAARQAGAHDFVTALPDGYDTVLGERAATLSGGQRQRLAVARAFIRDTPILILDEPTTGLDAESAALVAESLQTLTLRPFHAHRVPRPEPDPHGRPRPGHLGRPGPRRGQPRRPARQRRAVRRPLCPAVRGGGGRRRGPAPRTRHGATAPESVPAGGPPETDAAPEPEPEADARIRRRPGCSTAARPGGPTAGDPRPVPRAHRMGPDPARAPGRRRPRPARLAALTRALPGPTEALVTRGRWPRACSGCSPTTGSWRPARRQGPRRTRAGRAAAVPARAATARHGRADRARRRGAAVTTTEARPAPAVGDRPAGRRLGGRDDLRAFARPVVLVPELRPRAARVPRSTPRSRALVAASDPAQLWRCSGRCSPARCPGCCSMAAPPR